MLLGRQEQIFQVLLLVQMLMLLLLISHYEYEYERESERTVVRRVGVVYKVREETETSCQKTSCQIKEKRYATIIQNRRARAKKRLLNDVIKFRIRMSRL
jgi:hypothetical protein